MLAYHSLRKHASAHILENTPILVTDLGKQEGCISNLLKIVQQPKRKGGFNDTGLFHCRIKIIQYFLRYITLDNGTELTEV